MKFMNEANVLGDEGGVAGNNTRVDDKDNTLGFRDEWGVLVADAWVPRYICQPNRLSVRARQIPKVHLQ